MYKKGTNLLVKNSKKYSMIYEKYNEFESFVKSYKLKENGKF